MVHQIILTSKYRVFLESLILSLLILIIGISIGFYIENYRTDKVVNDYKVFEINALDLKLQNYYYQIMNTASCNFTIESNLKFADEIYDEGLLIAKYEETQEFSDNLLLAKKRYVLLKTELWLNSILLKQKCKNAPHTVVYIYSQTGEMKKSAEQEAVSNELKKLKEKYGNEIVLIPIAGDLELDSVDLQMKIYNIQYLPSVLIDEKVVLEGYHSASEIEENLN
ncbi:MAG: hypothetical protein WC533_02980 [Candidatus Pacearchaeota archaeon]